MANEWWKTASATFAGGAVAISLVAIPTYVWLPREFDEITGKLDTLSAQVTALESSSRLTSEAAENMVGSLDELIEAIALANAQPLGGQLLDPTLDSNPNLVAAMYPYRNEFLSLLPADIGQVLVADGKLEAFRYSRFNNTDWVYSKTSEFNGLSSDLQARIIQAFERQNVKFQLLP